MNPDNKSSCVVQLDNWGVNKKRLVLVFKVDFEINEEKTA